MEYRTLLHGGENISVIGLGMGSIHAAPDGASLIERMESRNGIHTLEHADSIGVTEDQMIWQPNVYVNLD